MCKSASRDSRGKGNAEQPLSIVQMPAGIPVGTLVVGKSGAVNVALLAVAIVLALSACTLKGTTDATTDATSDATVTTSGKSWLTSDGLIKDDEKATAFATVNFENLQQDMAQGQGEYLASLGTLLGVPRDRNAEFFTLAKEQSPLVLRAARTTPGAILDALTRALSATPALNQTVADH